MHRQYSFLLILPLIFTLSLLFFLHYNKGTDNNKNQKAVNAVIGNKSFLHVFGKEPTEEIPEQVRIQNTFAVCGRNPEKSAGGSSF
ncbi:MAG: hypothetical protein GVY07_07595 [Bacteroidetes bacterium]|jgi:hypothetical protein|nr:hypothetical protein [Bacteroidota bacterium]